MYQMGKVILEESVFKDYEIEQIEIEEERYKALDNLSKVNIFIGSNNSGKSRFIRNLFSRTGYKYQLKNLDYQEFSEKTKAFCESVVNIIKTRHIVGIGNLDIRNIETIYISLLTKEPENIFEQVNKLVKDIEDLKNVGNGLKLGSFGSININNESGLVKTLKEYAQEFKQMLNSTGFEIYNEELNYFRLYIPTLRGLRTFEGNNDIYSTRTKQDYFKDSENEVFTGLSMYEEIKKLLLGNLKDRKIVSDYQKFLSESFFENEEVTLIPNIDSDVLYVKIGKEKERPIFSLGDGIQSLIIMTFPLYKYRDKKLLMFIEEPEQYLHPGMQRKFLEIIYNYGDGNAQFFITTHSNHLLDMTLDMSKISIYTFYKELSSHQIDEEADASFKIINTSNEDESLLTLLGVKNSAVLMSNCTIWIEGITDRFYIRYWLKLYMEKGDVEKKFQEDIHFSFVEYGGNNITHWSFLEEDSDDELYKNINVDRLCAKLFLLTDKDGQKKDKRQTKLKEKLGERYYCLECREIENLVDVEVLNRVIAEYEDSSVENLVFKHNFTYDGYKGKLLGKFIEGQLLNKTRKGSYASKSGTIADKITFCKKIINHTNSFEELSEEAQQLTKKIYEFIAENN